MNEDIISNQKFQSRFSNGDVINQSIEENGVANSYQILLKNTLWNLQLQKDLLVKVFKIVDNIEYKLFEGNLPEFLDYMNSDYSEQILVESILNEEGENDMENTENMTMEQNSISTMLSDMIVDEWETIDKYNSVIASLPKTGEYEDIKNVINDIIKEEYMHVGQLESAIKTVDSIANHIEKGEMEGDLQLDESVEETAKFTLDESLFESENKMASQKYELMKDDKITVTGRTLFRIKACIDFTIANGKEIHKGDLGGFIEKESNLSQNGNCWIYGNAVVYEDAEVYDRAIVSGNARIFGNARVYSNSEVSGRAFVSGNARIYDNAEVGGRAIIYGNARVHDEDIYDDVRK